MRVRSDEKVKGRTSKSIYNFDLIYGMDRWREACEEIYQMVAL
jgi:hypothetical protein